MIAKDLTNQIFGQLTVLKRDNTRKDRAYWICKCSCGNIISVSGTKLRQGQQSCGCLKKAQLTNQRFGRLIAIKPLEERASNGNIMWECQCDCGNILKVRANNLTSGKTKSCGCLKKEQNLINIAQYTKDLSGNKYGRLTVLEQDLIRSKKAQQSYWICQCECGNIVSIRGDHLRRQETVSCGCQKQSAGETIIENLLKENNIEYKKEYSFSDLKSIYKLRFDFALFEKNTQNLVCLIEFDGLQHFIETNYYFNDSLQQIQERDKIKNEYCLSHNIPLFRIPYKMLSKLHSITDILNQNNLIKEI